MFRLRIKPLGKTWKGFHDHYKRTERTPVHGSPGTTFAIELPFLGSAGYGWHIEEVDSDHLLFLKEETKPIDTTGKIGGPILGVWHFLAVKQGTTSIRMSYYRAWEGPATALEQFAVEINVEQEIKK